MMGVAHGWLVGGFWEGVWEMPDNFSGSSVNPHLVLSGTDSTKLVSEVLGCPDATVVPASGGLETMALTEGLEALLASWSCLFD